MKKRVLLVVSLVVIVMGVLALFDLPNLGGKDPVWHAIIKIVVGLVGLWVSLKKTGKTKTALTIIGFILVVMGVLALIGWPAFTVDDPTWHAIVKIVIGLIAFLLGVTKMKND